MNNKFGFILPRILGMAVIAGIASFLLAMIAKLLIGAALIGGIVMAVKKGFSRSGYGREMMYGPQGNGPMQLSGASFYGQHAMPVNVQQRSGGIIPIN